MALRFWRRVRLAPGLTLNLSKSGASLSVGRRGARFTVGPRGRRATVGIPGTGLFYTVTEPTHRKKAQESRPAPLKLTFFDRLLIPKSDEALIDGCREMVCGNYQGAYRHFRRAAHLADGAFLAGFLALKQMRLDEAERYLRFAARRSSRLGRRLARYHLDATLHVPVAPEIMAVVRPNLEGVLLGLVEVYQRQGRWREAVECLERLRRLAPDDPLVALSLVEMLMEAPGAGEKTWRYVLRLTDETDNASPIHTALLLYRARALRRLGHPEAARQTLTLAMRRKRNRPDELRHALLYERALAHEDLGQKARARRDLERLYAQAPNYKDVARRLGL